MRAFWNVGRSCLASRAAHAPEPTPLNRPTARTFVRPSTHGALKAARTLAGSRRLPHAHGRTGCRHVHPTSQHEAPGLMLCLENRHLLRLIFNCPGYYLNFLMHRDRGSEFSWQLMGSFATPLRLSPAPKVLRLIAQGCRALASASLGACIITGKQTHKFATPHAYQQRLQKVPPR